jgi:undecaprenyl diphosphate synthase
MPPPELPSDPNMSGRIQITPAARRLAAGVVDGRIAVDGVDESALAAELSFADLPDVDLFIRTGGELRLSNFILWQAAYAELFFSPLLWPDFDAVAFQRALEDFGQRQRRFGRTGEQIGRGQT